MRSLDLFLLTIILLSTDCGARSNLNRLTTSVGGATSIGGTSATSGELSTGGLVSTASHPSDASVTDASNCYVPQVGCNGCNPHALAGIWTPQQVQNCKVTFDIEVDSFDAAGGEIYLYVDVDCAWRAFGSNEDGGLSWEPGPIIQVPSFYDTFLEVMPITVTLSSVACDLVNANINSHVYVFAGFCATAIKCSNTG